MTTHELRCTAGHVVGRVDPTDGAIRVQHKGREVCAVGVAWIRCACGCLWTPGQGLPLADLEYKAPVLARRR